MQTFAFAFKYSKLITKRQRPNNNYGTMYELNTRLAKPKNTRLTFLMESSCLLCFIGLNVFCFFSFETGRLWFFSSLISDFSLEWNFSTCSPKDFNCVKDLWQIVQPNAKTFCFILLLISSLSLHNWSELRTITNKILRFLFCFVLVPSSPGAASA